MNPEPYARTWLSNLKRILSEHPEAFERVEKMNEEKQYQEAFMEADRIIKKFRIEVDDAFENADSDFYWTLR